MAHKIKQVYKQSDGLSVDYVFHASDGNNEHALIEVSMPWGSKHTKSAEKMDRAAAKTARDAWLNNLERDYIPFSTIKRLKECVTEFEDPKVQELINEL